MGTPMKLDNIRQKYLAVFEAIDAMRLIPRILVGGYAYLVYKTVAWYMELEPTMIENCISANIVDCIIFAPTTQHAILLSTIIGASAAVIGLYTATGRKWNGFTPWTKEK